jgi:hypothetical protein
MTVTEGVTMEGSDGVSVGSSIISSVGVSVGSSIISSVGAQAASPTIKPTTTPARPINPNIRFNMVRSFR